MSKIDKMSKMNKINDNASQQAMQYATYPDLAGKRIVITGGGSGIGAEMVRAFALQGAQVFFLDIADGPSQLLVQAIADGTDYDPGPDSGSGSGHNSNAGFSPGPAPVYLPCDLTDLAALASAFATIHANGGAVDVLVNNAANDDRHGIADVTPAYWEARMAVNLRHHFFCAQAVAGPMAAAGGGVIVNLGSISWHLALPELSLYMTAKAAIEGLTRGLARDLGPSAIRVNCVIPGAVRTPRQDELWHNAEEAARILAGQCLKQRVEVQDVAALVLFLGSGNARRCSGRNYFVDAGWFGA